MNKTLAIFLLVFTVWSKSAFSQSSKFEMGLEGGVSLTFLRGDQEYQDQYSPTIGFSGGVVFQYNFPNAFSIRSIISYERKGSLINNSSFPQFGDPVLDVKNLTNYNYLTIPILGRLNYGNKIKFFINAGPYFGYLIKHNVVTKAYDENPRKTSDITETDKRFDVGLTTGFGGVIAGSQKLLLTIEVRNNLGLYNISEVPVAFVSSRGSILTNSTNLLLGLCINLAE